MEEHPNMFTENLKKKWLLCLPNLEVWSQPDHCEGGLDIVLGQLDARIPFCDVWAVLNIILSSSGHKTSSFNRKKL